MVKYGERNANEYLMGTVEYSRNAQEEREIEANVKAAKMWIKRLVLCIIFALAIAGMSGCTNDNSNPVQGLVCATQNTPSIVCPNAGK